MVEKGDGLYTLQRLTTTMVLLLTGILAGLQTLMLMGILPAIARMPLAAYVGMWQTINHFMSVRMPILVNATLLVYLIAILSFARSRRKWILWTLSGCFALLAIDTVFTVAQQLPVNRAVQALDVDHLADMGQVQRLRDATIEHFRLRGWLSISAFVWLLCAVVLSPDCVRVIASKGTPL